MRKLSPVDVLTIIILRLEKRADCLEGVRMPSYEATAYELRRFAEMMKNAREYLRRA